MLTNVTSIGYNVRSPLAPILLYLSQAQGYNQFC